MALGLGALAFGVAGKGCERSPGSVWPQRTHRLFRASQYRVGMKVTRVRGLGKFYGSSLGRKRLAGCNQRRLPVGGDLEEGEGFNT